eukprot:789162_1
MGPPYIIYLNLLLIYSSLVQSDSWYGSHFLCHGRNTCYDDQIHCDANTPCVVDCHGPNACQYAVIHCPTDSTCDVTCGGGIDACKDVVFLAKRSTSLTITCDRSHEEAFDRTLIYCPDNGPGGPISCHISGVSEVNVATKMEIFAVEGLNDVEIDGTYVTLASLYCKIDYSSPCTLMNSSPFNLCASSDKTCEDYMKPTPQPSPYPTVNTAAPTYQPTTTSSPTTRPTQGPLTSTTLDDEDTQTPAPITSLEPTGSPTLTTDTPTHYPTLTPTGRPRDLEYTPRPTRYNPRYDTPTSRPTRSTRARIWETTTTQHAAFNIADDDDDLEQEDDTNDETEYEESESNLKPLYYVVGALFLSICYVSVSLFCWVHYNQKYTTKVNEIKSRNACIVHPQHIEKRVHEPRVPRVPPHVPMQARRMPMSTSIPREADKNPYQLHVHKNHHMNRPRLMTGSTIAASDAPTSMNESHSNAPTSSRGSGSTCSCSNCSTDDDDEFKEVDYETNGGMIMEEHEEESSESDLQSVRVNEEEEEFKEVDYETTTAGEPTKKVFNNNAMFSSSMSASMSRPIPNNVVYSMGIQMPSVSASHGYGYNRFMTQQWPPPPPPGQ